MNFKKAQDHLRQDKKMSKLIDKHPKPALGRREDPFASLIRSIISQQISMKAAQSIFQKFKDLYGGVVPEPKDILLTEDEKLRSVGLSKQKVSYIKDLSEKVSKQQVKVAEMDSLSDEEIIRELTKVKGIGEWSAQMFLMFNLGRLDVFPVGDLGIVNGMKKIYKLEDPTKGDLIKRAEKWKPYRSVACWYIWQELNGGGF